MIYRSLFGRIFFPAMIFSLIALSSYGQEVLPTDSIPVSPSKLDLLPPTSDMLLDAVGYEMDDYLTMPGLDAPRPVPKFKPEYYPNFHTDKSPLYKGDYDVAGVMRGFRRGAIYGIGRQETIPGIGTINHAGIGYIHSFNDNFSMNFQVDARRGSTPYYRTQSFGASGSFSYRLNDVLTLNAFGGYSMMPTSSFQTYDYGGSLRVQITDRFSTEVGVRRHYNSATGQWETIPIIIPAYKFSEKFTLGVDVGGLLKYLLQDVVFQPRGDFTSPTIRPQIP